MIRVTLKGLAGRRLRAALTALAIVLGVAMVSGTLAFTDRIENAVDTLFTGAYSGADAVVSGKDVVESSTTGDAAVPAELLRSIAAVPEVDAVAGGIVDTARLLDRAGRPISTQDQALGLSVDARPEARRFNPLALTAGRWPTGSDETASTPRPPSSTDSKSATRSASPHAARCVASRSPASPGLPDWTRSVS